MSLHAGASAKRMWLLQVPKAQVIVLQIQWSWQHVLHPSNRLTRTVPKG